GMEMTENVLLERRMNESRVSQQRALVTLGVANSLAAVLLVITAIVILRWARAKQPVILAERAARERAEAANRAKDTFLNVLSHELRTPLTAVFGWIQLMKDHQLNPQKTDMALEVIDRNLRLQTQLIDDLLNTSQVIAGKLEIRPEAVDANVIVRATVAAIQPLADSKKIRITTVTPPDPVFLHADAARLHQIIGNLLSNAVKFSGAGSAIQVEVRPRPAVADIIVRDTGEGIPPEFLPHVFDRFTQADASKTRTHGGLGLGLALVYHLVELHGGTVQAASEGRGKGSTFTVTLPRSHPQLVRPAS
ncbi:MAG TPA: HAMP domain-containing sensor histidine kinase, partial [Terriglobia bacterium]|nr:HAMP domain-containing sensor histidine kinase [Terriglobia bacterium]